MRDPQGLYRDPIEREILRYTLWCEIKNDPIEKAINDRLKYLEGKVLLKEKKIRVLETNLVKDQGRSIRDWRPKDFLQLFQQLYKKTFSRDFVVRGDERGHYLSRLWDFQSKLKLTNVSMYDFMNEAFGGFYSPTGYNPTPAGLCSIKVYEIVMNGNVPQKQKPHEGNGTDFTALKLKLRERAAASC